MRFSCKYEWLCKYSFKTQKILYNCGRQTYFFGVGGSPAYRNLLVRFLFLTNGVQFMLIQVFGNTEVV